MKRYSIAAICLLCVASVQADQPGTDWLTREQVVKKLEALGYSQITGLEADDGHWEGKGVKNGTIMEFHVDPHTGLLTKEEVDQ